MKSSMDSARVGFFACAMVFACAAHARPGDRDPTYGQGGRTVISLPSGVRLQANRFIQQADGKTVIVGWTGAAASPQDFAVVRLNEDGSPDTTFDGDGVAVINFNNFDMGLGIVQQPSDGKLVVVGYTSSGTCMQGPCIAATRLNTNGTIDPSFGVAGQVVLNAPSDPRGVGSDVLMQGSNIVIGAYHSPQGRFVFVRLTSAGSVDGTFNANTGATLVQMGTLPALRHMIAQADGSILAVGGVGLNSNATTHHMGIARITSAGVPDTTFNGTGTLITSCTGPCQYTRVAQQSDQKLLFVGYDSLAGEGTPPLKQQRSILERRNLDGSLDTSFGTGGQVTNVFASLEPHPVAVGEIASGIAVDPTTGITVLGRMTTQMYLSDGTTGETWIRQTVARFTPSGAPDTSFGSGGLRLMPTSVGPNDDALGVGWFNVNHLVDGRVLTLGNASRTINGVTEEGIAVGRLSNGNPGDPGVLTVTGFAAPESAPFAWAVIARTAGSSGPISVSYTTASVTATAGADFTATSGTLSWADGDVRSKLIKVPLISDSIAESSDETFQIVLSNPSAGVDIANVGTVTIVRDDVPPANTVSVSYPGPVFEASGNLTFTVSRTGTDAISVNYTTAWDSGQGPVAQSPSDYGHVHGILVWSAGDTTPKTITIPLVNDGVSEPAEELNLAFFIAGGLNGVVQTNSLQTVTIHDGSAPQIAIAGTASVNESQTSATVNVTRSGSTTATVSVNYATSNATAVAGSDYTAVTGTLTWSPGDPDVKTITIPLLGDTIVEGNESFTVALSNPVGGATLSSASSTVTIIDDDAPPPPPPGGGGGGGGTTSLDLLALLCGLSIVTIGRRTRSRVRS